MNAQEPTRLGKNLKRIRKQTGLSQADVAKKAGISKDYYPLIERGKYNPTIAVVSKLAKALDVELSDLF